MSKIVQWFWEQKNARGRWRRLGWRMDEQSARQHAEVYKVAVRKVAGSREEREDYYGDRGYGGWLPTPRGE